MICRRDLELFEAMIGAEMARRDLDKDAGGHGSYPRGEGGGREEDRAKPKTTAEWKKLIKQGKAVVVYRGLKAPPNGLESLNIEETFFTDDPAMAHAYSDPRRFNTEQMPPDHKGGVLVGVVLKSNIGRSNTQGFVIKDPKRNIHFARFVSNLPYQQYDPASDASDKAERARRERDDDKVREMLSNAWTLPTAVRSSVRGPNRARTSRRS